MFIKIATRDKQTQGFLTLGKLPLAISEKTSRSDRWAVFAAHLSDLLVFSFGVGRLVRLMKGISKNLPVKRGDEVTLRSRKIRE